MQKLANNAQFLAKNGQKPNFSQHGPDNVTKVRLLWCTLLAKASDRDGLHREGRTIYRIDG